jgi:hypothetical protein
LNWNKPSGGEEEREIKEEMDWEGHEPEA